MEGRKRVLLAVGMCLFLSACGKPGEDVVQPADFLEEGTQAKAQPADKESGSDQDTAASGDAGRGDVILDQSFGVSLSPLGDVRFVSYAPARPDADAVFAVERDGAELLELEGMRERNIRTGDTFGNVEAVSFPDFNRDGYSDIIIICSYLPEDGPEAFSEVRLYEGTSSGEFLFQKELSEEAASALADITVESVKRFLGADRTDGDPVQAGWQQAYIDHIGEHQDINDGFALIYLDGDEIPELVEIGDCEASGCRIVVFSDGGLKETQLYRLYFSYIEKENLLCNSDGHMDVYYDYVYCIRDGELVMAEKGDYGAPDNAKLQFDGNGDPVYDYYWNGEKMTKEEYERKLHAVYDPEKARDGYRWGEYDSAESMIEKLRNL